MNDEQFKQWQNAKAWELAALIRGPFPDPFPEEKDWYRLHVRYGDLQKWILKNIL